MVFQRWWELTDAPSWQDVRDVALAHLRALERPEAHGRYVVWSDAVAYTDFYRMLGDVRPGLRHKLPRVLLPRFLHVFMIWYLRLRLGKGVADIVGAGLGKLPRFDTRRTQHELGIAFRPALETIRASVEALEDWKVI